MRFSYVGSHLHNEIETQKLSRLRHRIDERYEKGLSRLAKAFGEDRRFVFG